MPLAQHTCRQLVPRPIDSPPIRSPQAVHSFLVERIAGKDLVEIGTRNGDGMNCFTHYAKHATAIEIAPRYCKSLLQASEDIDKSYPGKGYNVTCSDYRRGGVLDADIITWWEQFPLTNDEGLKTAYKEQRAGRVRSSAEAILLFDPKWFLDVEGWKRLCPLAGWSAKILFNEHQKCIKDNNGRSPKGPATCDRAHGFFIVAGFPITRVERFGTFKDEEKALCEKRHRLGLRAVTNVSAVAHRSWPLHTEPQWQLHTEPWYSNSISR